MAMGMEDVRGAPIEVGAPRTSHIRSDLLVASAKSYSLPLSARLQ
jgi:hypothetical protein